MKTSHLSKRQISGEETMLAPEFKHYMHIASGVLVLRIDGQMTRARKDELEKILAEVTNLEFQNLIINLVKVTRIDRINHRFLVQLRNHVKGKGEGKTRVLLSGVLNKDELIDQGIIAKEEVCTDMRTALESL